MIHTRRAVAEPEPGAEDVAVLQLVIFRDDLILLGAVMVMENAKWLRCCTSLAWHRCVMDL